MKDRQHQASSKQFGLTLTESMVVVAILSLFLTLASPMSNTTQRFQAKNAATQLMSSVKMAFSESNFLGREVTICASSNGTTCSGNNNWEQGWITFYSENSGIPILIEAVTPPAGLKIFAAGFTDNDTLTIRPTLQRLSEPAQIGIFASCSHSASTPEGGLIVSNTGLALLATDSDGDGILESYSGTAPAIPAGF